jgi:hypothetical protein
MRKDADRTEHQATAPAQRRNNACLARADALEPPAPDRGEAPNNTKNKVNIQPRLAMRQSQVVVNNSSISDISGQATDLLMPIARDSGIQNTLKP